jgi:short-subunit dehydrogenase
MSDHVAVVTGASRGIGPHIAGALAEAGHPVVLVARTTSLIEGHAAEINASGGRAVAVTADVTRADERMAVVAAAADLGAIGVLVNNAAVGPILDFHDHDTADVDGVVDLNLVAPIELSRLVVREMLAAGTPGRIVNVATVAAKLPMPHMVLYSVTKAALSQLSAALDVEYRDRGIRASTVLPGAVADEGMSMRAVEETGVAIPNDGAVVPERVARAVVAAIGGGQPEIYVGAGSRFMTRHPRLAYRLMRKSGVFDALERAAGEYRRQRTAA